MRISLQNFYLPCDGWDVIGLFVKYLRLVYLRTNLLNLALNYLHPCKGGETMRISLDDEQIAEIRTMIFSIVQDALKEINLVMAFHGTLTTGLHFVCHKVYAR